VILLGAEIDADFERRAAADQGLVRS